MTIILCFIVNIIIEVINETTQTLQYPSRDKTHDQKVNVEKN